MKTPKEYKEMEFAGVMIELAKLFKPEFYVELGVRKGATLLKMAPYVKRAVGVDINPVAFNPPDNVSTYKCSTLDFAQGQKSESIDFLFIDADHDPAAVLADLKAFLPKVKTGTGLIFLHDTHPIMQELTDPGYCNNAWKAADMVFHGNGYPNLEIVTLPGPWAGLSILRKRGTHHLSWQTKPCDEFDERKTDDNGESGSDADVSREVLRETKESDVESGNPGTDSSGSAQAKKSGRRQVRNR